MVCPNELICGDNGNKFITPQISGEKLVRALDTYSWDYKFVEGDVCSWVITTPRGTGFKDFHWLSISRVKNAEVYVAKTKDYKETSMSRATLGKKYGMLRGSGPGKDYYVIVYSESQFKGTVKL